MDKLLKLVQKLRDEIVPESSVSKMAKPELLSWIEEANLLSRMRTFHGKGTRGIRSSLTDDEEDTLVPSNSELQRWRIGKLRKLVRNFHKATQILKKYEKFSASRLRSHIKRHRYEEMLFGDDLPVDTDDEDEKKKPKERSRKKDKDRKPQHTRELIREKLGNIVINTGDQFSNQPVAKGKLDDCCCPETNKLADQDFFGLIQKLAPNLYRTLAEKNFLLDMCALDKKRIEANVCPVDCRRKAWDEFTCCEKDETPAWFRTWVATQPVGGTACRNGSKLYCFQNILFSLHSCML